MKTKTAAEKRHLGKVAALGCIIDDCHNPANVHHIRTQRIKNHFLTIPLCREHHQGAFSIHNCQRNFEKTFGSELHLLAQTIEKLTK